MKNKKQKQKWLFSHVNFSSYDKTIVLLSCLFFSILLSSNVFAYSATITTNDNVVINASPAGEGVSIQKESITVISDCRNGYNLSFATTTDNNLYLNGDGANNTTGTYFAAVDETNALKHESNTNKWGYTLNSNPTSSTVFSALSTTAVPIRTTTQTSSPNSNINDTLSVNYGVKVDHNIVPGAYEMANNGAIVYYLTMDIACAQYAINYNSNGGTGTTTSQIIQEGVTERLIAEDFTAPTGASYTDANNNTIVGQADKLWTFWGWNTAVDGTGDWYKDREAVTNLTATGSTITLYAQWKQATLADLTTTAPSDTEKTINHNTMQDMSPETCYNSDITTAINAPGATLIDIRDGTERSYNVSKLADSKCWMTTNLNLGSTVDITLTPDDTDISSNFILPASSNNYSNLANAANINTPNNLNNRTITSYTVNGTTFDSNVASYYTYAAATADTTTYDKTDGYSVTTSICPKNWDLPTEAQYIYLKNKGTITSANKALFAPYDFTYGGYRGGTSNFTYETTLGYYWTSLNSGRSYSSWVGIHNRGLDSGNAQKYLGAMVRCIASQGKITINYDGNGTTEYPVTGTVASQENVEINATNAQVGSGFARNGWVFSGWNTATDGNGITIAAGASLSAANLIPGSTITLYAQWTPQYTITYTNNCITYAGANTSCTQAISDSTGIQKINLDSSGNGSATLGAYNYNSWTLAGWKIAGWSTVADNSDGTNPEYVASSNYLITGASAGDNITLYAHWAPPYSIQYDGNNPDNPNGMGITDSETGNKSVQQINVGENDPVTLLASNFKKSGYGFAGWSIDDDAYAHLTDNDDSNDPIIYGPNETISAPAYPTDGTDVMTMYAVWIPAKKDGNDDPVYLQDFGANECDNLTKANFDTETGAIIPGSVIALTDKRDNQVYTIAKLADDKCWMIENLRLEHEGTIGNNINDDTITNESLSQGYSTGIYGYGNFVGLAEAEDISNFHTHNANTIYKSDGSGSVFDPALGTLEDIGVSGVLPFRFPRYNHWNTAPYNSSDIARTMADSTTYTQNYMNAISPSDSGTNYRTSSNLFSLGNYYTWAAAVANASNSGTFEAETSICPSGWTLPSSGTATKDFGNLSQSYGGNGGEQTGGSISNRFRSFPNNFLYSGQVYDFSIGGRGKNGDYWSRSSNPSDNAYYFSLQPEKVYPSSYYGYKDRGYSVRCLVNM